MSIIWITKKMENIRNYWNIFRNVNGQIQIEIACEEDKENE